MRVLPSTFVCACYVVWLAAGAAFAQSAAQLVGFVRDGTGEILRGVVVTVGSGTPELTRRAVTNEQGWYEFETLPPGDYVIEAALVGFQRALTAFSMRSDPVRLDLVLTGPALAERVTVTATKTGAADVQTTPAAVTVLPATMLEQAGVEDIEGLAGVVPAVTISQNAGLAQLTIRGIGTNVVATGGDPSSTVHLDGIYLARPSMAFSDLLNVERVEVLRGPQGTVYGRNSVGGTINIITRQPTNSLDSSVRIAAGGYHKLRIDGAVSGPLVKNRVMGNFAFLRGVREGFVRDLGHPDRPLGGEDVWAGRGQLRVVLGRAADVLLSGDYRRNDGIPLGYAKPLALKPGPVLGFDRPAGLWVVRTSDAASGHNIQQGGSAKLVVRVNATTTLTSLTAHRRADYRTIVDSDITELKLQAIEIGDLQHQTSQEVTLARRTRTLAWVLGAFLFDEHVDGPVLITLYRPGTQGRPHATIQTRAWAVFGEGTHQVSDRVSFTTGIRYSDEAKDLANTGGIYRLETTRLVDPSSFYQFVDRATFAAWTPKVSVQMRASSNVFGYASASRGFKSGGFNPSWPVPDHPYSPEFAWSYEGGLKSTLADGRLGVNVAAFYNDYRDLQVQSFIRPGLLDITNAASATVRGVEIESTAAPRGIQLAGHVSWIDATYDSYTAVGDRGVKRDAAGHRLNNAPGWSGRGSATRAFATPRGGTLTLSGAASWQSRVFFTPFNDRVETQEAYGLVHLHAGFQPRQHAWEIAVYARNIGNQAYITGTSSSPIPAIGGRPGEPRQWGTQVTLRH
jgi:iron complex outermembrane recepter protein